MLMVEIDQYYIPNYVDFVSSYSLPTYFLPLGE